MLKPLIALPCAALLTIGCRAAPAPDSGFLKQPALMANDESLPFNRVWFNPKYRNQAYSELYVAPVNTDYIMAENIWEKASVANISQDNVKQNVEMLAEYQRSEILKAVQNYPKNTFKIVAKPGPNTLILEVALVQLVPSKSLLQAASYYSWIATAAMYAGSLATNSPDEGKGFVAMEARTRDGRTGEIVSMAADRERPPTAVIDIKAFFWWESVKPICTGWARQFVEFHGNAKGTKIEEIPNFQFFVW